MYITNQLIGHLFSNKNNIFKHHTEQGKTSIFNHLEF